MAGCTICFLLVLLFLAVPVLVRAKDNLTDEEFFGVWDKTRNTWQAEGKINYSYHGSLKAVESAVKVGDYRGAKEALLAYCQNEKKNKGDAITGKEENNQWLAVLGLDDIFTGPGHDKLVGIIAVEAELQAVRADVTKVVEDNLASSDLTFMLMARKRDGFMAEFISREADKDKAATLRVKVDGIEYVIKTNKDTYITGGSSQCFGSAKSLLVEENGYVEETGNPFTERNRRGYINFSLQSLPKNGTVESATLELWGRAKETCSKEILVFYMGDTAWEEDTFSWHSKKGNIYSWQGVSSGPTWDAPVGSDIEYVNVINRFGHAEPMVNEYIRDKEKNEAYAEKFFEQLTIYMQKHLASHNRNFECSVNAGTFINCYYALRHHPRMTPYFNTELLKFMWQKAEYLAREENFYSGNNWGLVQTNGFFRIVSFFPEFQMSESWYELAMKRLTIKVRNSNREDMSFTESSGYQTMTMGMFCRIVEFGMLNDKTFSDEFKDALSGMAKYCMDTSFPNTYSINFGDGSYASVTEVLKSVNKLIQNETIDYFISKGQKGKAPAYTSLQYPVGQFAIMRDGWRWDKSMFAILNNDSTGHQHNDSLQILNYAYGSPLLIDTGRYTYNATEPVTKWLRGNEAHNTIEIDGQTQQKNACKEKQTSYFESNEAFDFAEQSLLTEVGDVHQSRALTFIKGRFWIVSDDLKSNKHHSYQQTWHFMPDNGLICDETSKTARTRFQNQANLMVIPSEPSNLTAAVKDGYYSGDYGLLENVQYQSYTRTGTNVNFDTVLYPIPAGAALQIVTAEKLSLDTTGDSAATAMKIGMEDTVGYYYISHEREPSAERTFGAYSYDGKMVYVQERGGALENIFLVGGSRARQGDRCLIEAQKAIDALAVIWKGNTLSLASSCVTASQNRNEAIKIYAPGIQMVLLNGTPIDFATEDGFVYAVK